MFWEETLQETDGQTLENIPDDFIVNTSLIARWLGVTSSTVRLYVRNGQLPPSLPRENEKDQHCWRVGDIREAVKEIYKKRRY